MKTFYYKLSAMDNPDGTFPFKDNKYVPLKYNEVTEAKIIEMSGYDIRAIFNNNAQIDMVKISPGALWHKVNWEICVTELNIVYDKLVEKLSTCPTEVTIVNYISSLIQICKVAERWLNNQSDKKEFVFLTCN